MDNITNLLQELGFTDYEAKAYVVLLQQHPLNGYELAKVSGIPRPNVYKVLQKLEAREVVIRADSPNSAVYSPIAPTELTKRLSERFNSLLDATSDALESVSRARETDYAWNIEGYQNIIQHIQMLIEQTEKTLWLAVWRDESERLTETISDIADKGIEVNILCLQVCTQACEDCRGTIYRYPIISSQTSRWLIAIQDETEVLMADIWKDSNHHELEATGIRSKKELLVQIATWYIRNSIALTAVLNDMDANGSQALSAPTRSLLKSIGPDENGWLAYLKRLTDQ